MNLGMTIHTHHFRDASMSSLESWTSVDSSVYEGHNGYIESSGISSMPGTRILASSSPEITALVKSHPSNPRNRHAARVSMDFDQQRITPTQSLPPTAEEVAASLEKMRVLNDDTSATSATSIERPSMHRRASCNELPTPQELLDLERVPLAKAVSDSSNTSYRRTHRRNMAQLPCFKL